LDLDFAGLKSLKDGISNQDLVTFTRASSGTFVGSDGVLRSAVTNLLTNSEAANTGFATLRSSISADVGISPVGTSTANKIVEDSTASSSHYLYRYQTIVAGATYTYSVYLKADGRTFALIGFGNNVEGNGARVGVNLTTGVVGTPFAFGTGTAVSASSVNVGNGWYRVILTGIADSSSTAGLCTVYLANSLVTSGIPLYSGDNTSGVLIWAAQLEQSSTVGEYIPTTSTINSAPRFDHNPTTGESLGLMGEEARTNLCLYSQAISTAPWAGNGFETCVASTLTDPAGTLNAFKINLGAATFERWQQPITVVNGTTYTLSAWVRSTTGTTLFRLRFGGGVTTADLTATTTWQRFSFTITSGTTAGFFAFNAPSTGAAAEIHVYGAQLEAGAFPTSDIPTTTATVTRAADVASITGSNFSSWYNQTEGTVFAEYRDPGVSGSNRYSCITSDGTTNNRIGFFVSGTTTINNRHVVGGTQANPGTLNTALSSRNRHAMASAVGSCNAASNGTLATASSPASMPTLSQLTIGAFNGAEFLNAPVARITFWPTRLSNTTLQQITQP
jgi:hypothetical protein